MSNQNNKLVFRKKYKNIIPSCSCRSLLVSTEKRNTISFIFYSIKNSFRKELNNFTANKSKSATLLKKRGRCSFRKELNNFTANKSKSATLLKQRGRCS
jgi:hypothetical protein